MKKELIEKLETAYGCLIGTHTANQTAQQQFKSIIESLKLLEEPTEPTIEERRPNLGECLQFNNICVDLCERCETHANLKKAEVTVTVSKGQTAESRLKEIIEAIKYIANIDDETALGYAGVFETICDKYSSKQIVSSKQECEHIPKQNKKGSIVCSECGTVLYK